MSIHPNLEFEKSLWEDKSWMMPEQARKVENIYLETTLHELEAERRLHGNAPFEEEFRYVIRTVQEELDRVADDAEK